jgi:3-polyprenyl-4-hydroxybenzoate decarboxylase
LRGLQRIDKFVDKNIIVCDTEVDIWNLRRVFWALAYRVDPTEDLIQYPGMIHALDPIVHVKDRIGFGGNKGTRLLIDATKSILRPRAAEYHGGRFAITAYPDEETMNKVRKNWNRYGIT